MLTVNCMLSLCNNVEFARILTLLVAQKSIVEVPNQKHETVQYTMPLYINLFIMHVFCYPYISLDILLRMFIVC